MAQRAENVTWGKPKGEGGIYVAPLGTTLPTDVKTPLPSAFKSLGFVSSDGLVNGQTLDTDDLQAWGGNTVLTLSTSSSDEFDYVLIESMNVEVLKFVYGEENVSGTLDTGIKVAVDSKPRQMKVFAVEMILREGVAKRIVIPKGEPILNGDISYTDGDATGFPIKIKCKPDENGKTHYEHLQRIGTTTNTGGTARS